jgi:hypothetical protein
MNHNGILHCEPGKLLDVPPRASKEPTANEKVRRNFESNIFQENARTNRPPAAPRCPGTVAKLHWNAAVSLTLHETLYTYIVHTCIHTYTYINTYIHTYIHTQVQGSKSFVLTHIPDTHTLVHKNQPCTKIQAYINTHVLTYTDTYTQEYMHKHIHIHTHTYAYIHMYTKRYTCRHSAITPTISAKVSFCETVSFGKNVMESRNNGKSYSEKGNMIYFISNALYLHTEARINYKLSYN